MKYILIIILVFVILGWLRRILFFGAAKALQKAAEEMAKQQQAQQASRKPEGSVTVENIKDQKTGKIQPGEYVDYEEVD